MDQPRPIHINRFLALCGVASRRKANDLIRNGRVSVNGVVVSNLGKLIDVDKDKVCFDGNRLIPPKTYQYILMNKPKGVITSLRDGWGRQTVLDCIESDLRVFPVGRLDLDTEGVLLLTNDGELAYRLTHPKYEIDKVYEVCIKGCITAGTLKRLEKGVHIGGNVIVQGQATIVQKKSDHTVIKMRIHEGKKRQIKRMMKALGHPVIALKRIRFAGLTLEGLQGKIWRVLSKEEVTQLYRLTGLDVTCR